VAALARDGEDHSLAPPSQSLCEEEGGEDEGEGKEGVGDF